MRSCEIFQAVFSIQMTGGSERVKGENEFFHGLIGFIGSCEMEFEHLENSPRPPLSTPKSIGLLAGAAVGVGFCPLCAERDGGRFMNRLFPKPS